MNKEIKNLTYDICKAFVKQEIPEEVALYDIAWKAMESLPKDWEKQLEKKEIKEKHLSILPEAVSSLVTPLVISIVAGVLSRLLYDFIKSKSGQKRFDKTTRTRIEHIATEIAVNAGNSEELGAKISSFIVEYFESQRNGQ